VSEKLDLTYFMEKLMQSKGETSFLAAKERFELWEKVKVLSMSFKPCTDSQFFLLELLSCHYTVPASKSQQFLQLQSITGIL
jgi:hypothetical protein